MTGPQSAPCPGAERRMATESVMKNDSSLRHELATPFLY